MDKPKTFTEIKDEFERSIVGGLPDRTALSIAIMATLDLLALYLPPEGSVDETEQVEQVDSAILAAVEYGYRCCEKGMNLQATLIEAKAKMVS